MNVLVIDIGGTNIKFTATGRKEPVKFPSGLKMSPRKMVAQIKKETAGWKYDAVAIGYPGVVKADKIITEPHNLAKGWVGFNFARALGKPVKLINDAAMQALGSYRKGIMLFLGLGTGLGTALVVDGKVIPMELAHLSYKSYTYEHYLGQKALDKKGRKKWNRQVQEAVEQLVAAFVCDDVVLGGGNVKNLKQLPAGCRTGDNANAFKGGMRLWE